MQKIEGLRTGSTTTAKSNPSARARGKSERVSEVRALRSASHRSQNAWPPLTCSLPHCPTALNATKGWPRNPPRSPYRDVPSPCHSLSFDP